MRVYDDVAQEMVEIPDPPVNLSLSDIWVEVKKTQVRFHKMEWVKPRVKTLTWGVLGLWALYLVLLPLIL